jgi:hypothetical protein
MLLAPRKSRTGERILLYGTAGVGKSFCWIDIAQKMYELGNPGKVYVIDTDNAVEAMFGEGYDHLEETIEYWTCYNWNDLKHAQEEIVRRDLSRDDWLVVDLLSFPYTEVRRHYTEMIYGQDLETYLLETASMVKEAEKRKEGHKRQFGDWESSDWDHMGKIYMAWEVPLTLRMKANVLATAEERAVSSDRGAKPAQVKKYAPVSNSRPYVNNTAEHRFRTVLRVSAPGKNRELALLKDRYREERWEKFGINNTLDIGNFHEGEGFVETYLRRIGKWRARKT